MRKRRKIVLGIAILLCVVGIIQNALFKGEENSHYLAIYIMSLIGLCVLAGIKLPIWGKRILWGVIPLLAYISFELIAGNLFTITKPYAIGMNIVFFYFIYLLVYALVGKFGWTEGICGIFFTIVALVDYFLSIYHKRPLMVADLAIWRTAANVALKYDYTVSANVLAGLAVQCFMFAVPLAERYEIKMPKKRWIALGLMICLFAVMAVCIGTDVGSARRHVYIDMWDPSDTYKNNGFWLCSIYEQKQNYEKTPEGYSVKAVEKIKEEYTDIKEVSKLEQPDNIIFIMNEAFCDFRVINDFQTNEEVTPFLDSLKKECLWGNLYTSVWGAYTSNTEYEVLTGNTMAFFNNPTVVPYQTHMKENSSSLVWNLKQEGYRNIAYHPASGTNYNRTTAYTCLGFDRFFDISTFPTKMIRGLTSDKSNYSKLKYLLNGKISEKMFLFNVTMQNHGGYGAENYEATIHLMDYPDQFPLTEQYLTLLHESDQAFQEFIQYLSKLDEKTVVVMWGDHQPAVETEFYEMLLGKDSGEWSTEDDMKRYITPFFVWANYSVETGYVDKISSNFLGAFIMEKIGIPLSGYQKFLKEVYQILPVVSARGYYDIDQNFYEWNEETHFAELLNKYRLLQYNCVFDTKNKLSDFF